MLDAEMIQEIKLEVHMTFGCLVAICAFFFGLGILTALFTKVMLVVDAVLFLAGLAFVVSQLRAERREDAQKKLSAGRAPVGKLSAGSPPKKAWGGNFAPSKVTGDKKPADGKAPDKKDRERG